MVKLCLPLKNGGMFSLTPRGMRYSSISKPLSAMTESLGSNKSSMPDLRVSCLSDIEPGNNFETNVIATLGEIPMRALYVYRCCHSYNLKKSFAEVLAGVVALHIFM